MDIYDVSKYGFDLLRNMKQFAKSIYFTFNNKFLYTYSFFDVSKYHKKSDILFILGTGTTINELDPADWNFIKNCDSIGMNFFCCHNFRPNILMFEHMDENLLEKFTGTIRKYKDEISPEVIMTSDHSMRSFLNMKNEAAELLNTINVCLKRSFVVYKIQFGRHRSINTFWFSRFLNAILLKRHFLHIRGSVSVAIDFGIKAGFKKIVFCGVDMDNRGHFYDLEKPNGALHLTAQRIGGNVTLGDYIRYLVRKYPSIGFSISSKSSKLSQFLPVYKWI